ncbi:MAG: DUF5106 domain-containing protein [Alistipes sp.]|nr:DUF5106 domain-containing protein [Alistipes sp.]
MKQIFYLALVALMVACGTQPSASNNEEEATEATLSFKLPYDDLTKIESLKQYEHYVAHFWDDFRFDIGDDVDRYSAEEVYSAFAKYVVTIPAPKADSLLRTLIHRAEASRPVLDFFAEMTGEILYDPNSPLRNDEYYIPILEELAKSPLYDEYDRQIPQHTLHIVKQNRLGEVANDFRYTLPNGTQHSLHALDADYTILLFNNPGCEMCKEVIQEIEYSKRLSELSSKHRIVTLAIYPDEDIEAWRQYLPQMPKGWTCGYDKEQALTSERLYDLKAIPSLYLLDRHKHVLVKDGVSIADIENIISQGIQL